MCIQVLTFAHVEEGSLTTLFKKNNTLFREGPLAQTNLVKLVQAVYGSHLPKRQERNSSIVTSQLQFLDVVINKPFK